MARIATKRKADCKFPFFLTNWISQLLALLYFTEPHEAPPEAGPSRTKQARTKAKHKKGIAEDSDPDEINSGSESSGGIFVGTHTSKPKKAVQNVRIPKVTRVVPAKKSGRVKKATRVVEEEEEDVGRTESQWVLCFLFLWCDVVLMGGVKTVSWDGEVWK